MRKQWNPYGIAFFYNDEIKKAYKNRYNRA